MTASLDDTTAQAIVSMSHAGDQEVLNWFQALRIALDKTRDQGGGAGELAEEIRSSARDHGMDSLTVEDFLTELEQAGSAYETVERLVDLEAEMPGLYWQLALPADEQEPQQAEQPMAWLQDDQRARVAGLYGQDWTGPLTEELTGRWGAGWQEHPPEHKAAWLRDVLTEWEQDLVSSEGLEDALDAEIASAVAEIDGAQDLSPGELAALRAELLAELTGMESGA